MSKRVFLSLQKMSNPDTSRYPIQIPTSPLKQRRRLLENQLSTENDTKQVRYLRQELEILKQKPIIDGKSIAYSIQVLSKELLKSRDLKRIFDFQKYLYSCFHGFDSDLLMTIICDLFDSYFDLMSTFTLVLIMLDRSNLTPELKLKLSRILKMFDDNSVLSHLELLNDMKAFNPLVSIVPNLFVLKDYSIVEKFVVNQGESKIDYGVMDWILSLEYDEQLDIGIPIDYGDYIGFANNLQTLTTLNETTNDPDAVALISLGNSHTHTVTEATTDKQTSVDEFQELNDRLQQLLNAGK